jgi:small subunit ribosomal protein S11
MAEDDNKKADEQTPGGAAEPAQESAKSDAGQPETAEKPVKKTVETKSDANDGQDTADSAEGAEGAEAGAVRSQGKRSAARGIYSGVAHIKATFNNTIVSITDPRGGVIAWSSAGRAGFKGSRKSTAFAATTVAQDAARQAMGRGLREVEVRVQGAGAGRESAIRALQSAGLSISVIKDVTPIPHNGCRARKMRRV